MSTFNWSPVIGDPSVMGWLTVLLYLTTAFYCLFLVKCSRTAVGPVNFETKMWLGLGVLFLALGVNKQLDLQTAITELGRVFAHQQGWYEQRRTVQVVFLLLLFGISGAMLSVLAMTASSRNRGVMVALVGTGLLLTFVGLRAASFHNFDNFISDSILGIRWNWILEFSGILTVFLGCRLRHGTLATRTV